VRLEHPPGRAQVEWLLPAENGKGFLHGPGRWLAVIDGMPEEIMYWLPWSCLSCKPRAVWARNPPKSPRTAGRSGSPAANRSPSLTTSAQASRWQWSLHTETHPQASASVSTRVASAWRRTRLTGASSGCSHYPQHPLARREAALVPPQPSPHLPEPLTAKRTLRDDLLHGCEQ